MPPASKEISVGLRAMASHGLDFGPVSATGQAVATCPWCGGPKFYANAETSQWDCKPCGLGGNGVDFLRQLWASATASESFLKRLAKDRGLLSYETLWDWGVREHPVTSEPVLPAWGTGEGRKLDNLHRYRRIGGKMMLPGTAGVPMANLFSPVGKDGKPTLADDAETVYVCEGPWDGMALWEVVRDEPGVAVVATPGANVWGEWWYKILAGKDVVLLYDNDHPREHPPGSGRVVDGAGLAGVKRVAGLLGSAHDKPNSVKYLRWGQTEQYDKTWASGYDVRDAMRDRDSLDGRKEMWNLLQGKVEPVPDEWLKAGPPPKDKGSVPLLPCKRWDDLVRAWKGPMTWTEGLDRALSVMLAAVISTETLGDQLWVRVLAPPSTGKTTLAEGVAACGEYVKSLSTFTGFHSGYKSDKEGTEDHSLIPQIRGKTLIVKDGDTILKSPNRDLILAEARDLYDTVCRAHYRHGVNRLYEGVRVTWILLGTGAMRELDAAELGARFLDVAMTEADDHVLEREVSRSVALRAFANVGTMVNGTVASGLDSDMLHARGMTGGYVKYLRQNAGTLLSAVRPTEDAVELCQDLGELVAHMRSRPSKIQDEVTEREFSARLVGQFARLSACLAAVLNRPETDDEVMRRVRRVALDTSAGRVMTLTKWLYNAGPHGAEVGSLAIWAKETGQKTRVLLGHMNKVGAAELVDQVSGGGVRTRPRWRLTEKLRTLYEAAVPPEEDAR